MMIKFDSRGKLTLQPSTFLVMKGVVYMVIQGEIMVKMKNHQVRLNIRLCCQNYYWSFQPGWNPFK